jgi:ribosome maturation factor RimP
LVKKDIIEQEVTKICTPIAGDLGLELVQVVYLRESYGWVVRILVDRIDGAVTLDDCSTLSRELSDVLDIEDPIETKYRLEVSSPGLDRPLVKKEDYQRFAGREITLKTAQPVEGRSKFKGRLEGLEENTVKLEVDGKTYELDLTNVKSANLVPDFGGFGPPAGN